MFQDISQSLVLIAFVWGALVNGGIQMGSVVYDPQRALMNKRFVYKGVMEKPSCLRFEL